MDDPAPDDSVAAASHHLAALAKSEFRLARAEVAQGARRIGVGIALAALTVVLVLLALGLLSAALIAWLVAEQGMALWQAAAWVGGGQLLLALVCALAARARLDFGRLAPTRSLGNLKRDLESLKELIHG